MIQHGNSLFLGQGRAETYVRRDIEERTLRDERPQSSQITELSDDPETKSKDAETSQFNPLHWRPTAGHEGEDRASEDRSGKTEDGPVSERSSERTACLETESTPAVCQKGLWGEEDRADVRSYKSEGCGSREAEDDVRSSDLFDSSFRPDLAYYTAATAEEARRTPSCPKDRWSNSATKGTKSGDEKSKKKSDKKETDAKASSTRHSSRKKSTQKTKERKTRICYI